MKNILTAILTGTLFYACQPSSQSETTTSTEETTPVVQAGYYGETIDESEVVDVTVLHHKLMDADSTIAKIKGTVVQTCKMKGCWMKVAMADGDTLHVTFKDYGFFVPKSGMEGKEVVFEGLAKNALTSVETLQHYAKDGGATEEEIAAITEPKQEVSFEASGVMIKDVEPEEVESETEE